MRNEHKMPDMGGKCSIMHREDGGQTFRIVKQDGELEQTMYNVFPGINLIYNDIHLPECHTDILENEGMVLEIDHCREGRMECQVDDEYFYITAGDVAIHRLGNRVREESFPTSHYHGITIQLDLQRTPRCLSCLLSDVEMQPAQLVEKYRLDQNLYFAFRQMPSMEHIFSELYNVPESIRKGYMKLKVLELLLFLSSIEPVQSRLEQRRFSAKQVELAKAVYAYLMERMEQHITIEQLSKQFGASVSMIKVVFSGVYGMSIGAYMRSQRMHAAARILQETDRTIMDIANQFGYGNSSKFAAAFSDVLGVTPAQYRKDFLNRS